MNNISKAIRHNRFSIIQGQEVVLHVQAPTGNVIKMKLVNCSLMGLGAISTEIPSAEDGLSEGAVLPPAKLTWNDQECYLGRIVLRSIIKKSDQECFCGFQTIDNKVPIDGSLSRIVNQVDANIGNIYEFDLNPEKFTLASFVGSEQSNVDLFARCKQFSILFKKWRETPKYQYRTIRMPSKGTRITTDQKRRGHRNDYIIMGSNDYLGLAAHPRVVEAAKRAMDQYGFGSTGSPMTTGLSQVHEELTDMISRIFSKKKAILYNSGYAANLGVLPGLTGEQDLVVADVLSHASIADGMQLAKSTSRFFRHNDIANLEKVLSTEREKFAGCLVVTEGVFSMDGDVAPIDKIVNIAAKYNARVMVDEAHSFGVIGPSGLGASAKFNALPDVDVVMGTFSKICGGIGGFIVSDSDVVDWLYHMSRAHVFSVSIPPSTAAAALEALKIFLEDDSLVQRLRDNIKHFCDGLRHLGFKIALNHESSVIPVTIGDERILGQMNASLKDDGVFVVPIVYPAVSRSGCRFRFTVMAPHTMSDLDYVLGSLEKAMLKAGFKHKETAAETVDRVA